MSEHGERLNIRKATLREWRKEFARHLREQGVAANATERAVRGESRTRETDGIYRASIRGDSTHARERAAAVASELLEGDLRIESGRSKLRQTRRDVARGWRAVSDLLVSQGEPELATQVTRFLGQMPPPRTEKESLALGLIGQVRRGRINAQQVGR